jgi:broad specificity phosphatase PhoE
MSATHAQSTTAPPDTLPSTSQEITSETISTTPLAPFLLRLHLIRHGETEANASNIVLGQGDSPLTANGLALAALAATSDLINGRTLKYWRAYCSDLHRAHRTARIVLGFEDVDGNVIDSSPVINLVVDPRLRELAKGAREGFLKSLSYGDAMELRARDSQGEEVHVPLLESINDAWERVKEWIDSLIQDVSDDFYAQENNEDDSDVPPKVYDVFALSHSALIRTMIHKMVDAQLPEDYAKTKEGSLRIPNLSCTTIDVRPHKDTEGGVKRGYWAPSLVRLTDVSHLNGAAALPSRPPYL